MDANLEREALDYHRAGHRPGKIAIQPTKAMLNGVDLSLAYSPGVAAPCLSIADDPAAAAHYTSRSNLVAVISNGTAVLGLGNIGALASKPVMEGKACLFKKFADVDVFDIEIDETDPGRLVDIIAGLEPTFGGINLEDIKAPECFEVERRLRERLAIPVFHDDQHGTAIVAAAAILNAADLTGRAMKDIRLVCSGAGAAAIACLDILVSLGIDPANILVADTRGVLHQGRNDLDAYKRRYARDTPARTLADAIEGADVFLGLSAAGVLKPEMVARMASDPIVLAMANPEPEIRPEAALAVRPDCIIGTGRSDYPNQVNNVLCFPFIFRGALDCGATTINDEMKIAAALALAELARERPSPAVARALGRSQSFGRDCILPSAFDPRLISWIAPAVAKAAAQSGVAARPIADLETYRRSLRDIGEGPGAIMRRVMARAAPDGAKPAPRVAFAGDNPMLLVAAEMVAHAGIARPVLIGERSGVSARIADLGLALSEGEICEIASEKPGENAAAAAARAGAEAAVFAFTSRKAGLTAAGVRSCGALHVLGMPDRSLFVANPWSRTPATARAIAEAGDLAAAELRQYGVVPRILFLSPDEDGETAAAVRDAADMFGRAHPDTASTVGFGTRALDPETNLVVTPEGGTTTMMLSVLRALAGPVAAVGPILLGAPAHLAVLDAGAGVDEIVNMASLAIVRARASRCAGDAEREG